MWIRVKHVDGAQNSLVAILWRTAIVTKTAAEESKIQASLTGTQLISSWIGGWEHRFSHI